MAKNVVLKDADGNELRTRLYKHHINVYFATEQVEFAVNILHYSQSNEPISNIENLKNIMVLDFLIPCLINDAGDTGFNFSGFIEFRRTNMWVGIYDRTGMYKEDYVDYTNDIDITDDVIPV